MPRGVAQPPYPPRQHVESFPSHLWLRDDNAQMPELCRGPCLSHALALALSTRFNGGGG
ncbi:hypothetical protein CSIRO_3743 [Bradyrhizobiaceae bacterium SG-6C]|nr:hypothetical protein CSIRO_3743 [Bradyrhizobiaceae bacterium SG-6C]